MARTTGYELAQPSIGGTSASRSGILTTQVPTTSTGFVSGAGGTSGGFERARSEVQVAGGQNFSGPATDQAQEEIRLNPDVNDRRVRLRPKSEQAWDLVFGNGGDENILSVLHPNHGTSNGVIFPYTPTITYSYFAEWSPYALVHTNYHTQAYARSYVEDIVITGQFTAQSTEEAQYSFATIHFFRTLTKMYYGRQDAQAGLAGTPPPTLIFSGYGNGMFNDIPVVVKSFSHELLSDADYVPVQFNRNAGTAWIPSVFTIILTLGVQHNLVKVRDEFSLDKFRSGELLTKNKGFL